MLADERRERILEHVRAHGSAKVTQLTRELEVSDMTVRRDLAWLDSQGLLEKVHGGAVRARSADEPEFSVTSAQQLNAKRRIARAAAALVQPGDSVAMSAGSTTAVLARVLSGIDGLTVITNSLAAEEEFSRAASSSTVCLVGGERTPSNALVGPFAARALEGISVDWLFLGAHSATLEHGLATPNLAEAHVNRLLVGCALRTVAVFDHTKWGVRSLATFAEWSQIHTVVTDADEDLPRDELTQRVESVIVV